MWKEKKYPYGLFFLALIACLAAGYFISGIFADGQPALSDIPDKLNGIMRDPFKNYWNEKSLPCMGCGFIGWLYFISQYTFRNRNFQFGIENGAERWADPKEIKLGDKDPKKNWRLSENVEVSKTLLSNNNILLVGSPGTGKSTGFFIPELLKASASFVVMDIKGELLSGYGNYLEEQGVRVQSLNLKEPEKSNQFNPFVFIHKDIDLIRVITSIQESTTPPDAQKGEPFWDEGVSLYLMALMYYVWLESPAKNLPEVLRLANKEEQTVDKDGTTELEILMERLTLGPRGKEHPAYKNYRKLKGGHEETVRSIILMVNAKLRLLEVPEIARIFTENELDIDSLGTGKNWDGKTKTAIFLVLPEQDKSFDFLLGMVYTQIFNRLIELADTYFCGPLPVPVEFLMDEFANGVRPVGFDKYITTIRSRNMSAAMAVQSIDQLKTVYKGDTWGTLMDACSIFLFLGAGRGSYATHEFISKLLGSATIDKRSEDENRGQNKSSGLRFDRAGRELLTPAEVARMPKNKCILLLEAQAPVIDNKYRPFKEKEFLYAKSLGKYEAPVIVRKNQDGSYETRKAKSSMELLTPEGAEHYKRLAEQNSGIKIFRMDEEEFLSQDFSKRETEELDFDKIRRILSRKRLEEAEKEEEEKKEIPEELEKKSILEWIKAYPMSDEQIEEIIKGLEDGLNKEEIREYFFLPVEEMRKIRRLLTAEKRNV